MVVKCSSSRDNMLICTNIREIIEYGHIRRYYLLGAIPPYLPQFDGVCVLGVLVIDVDFNRFSFPLPLPFALPASIFNILCLLCLRNLRLLSIPTSQILFNVQKVLSTYQPISVSRLGGNLNPSFLVPLPPSLPRFLRSPPQALPLNCYTLVYLGANLLMDEILLAASMQDRQPDSDPWHSNSLSRRHLRCPLELSTRLQTPRLPHALGARMAVDEKLPQK